MKLWVTILIAVAAVAAGVVFTRSLAPHEAVPYGSGTDAGNLGGDTNEPAVPLVGAKGFRLELVEGADAEAAKPDVIIGRDGLLVWRFASGGEWRRTATETIRTSPALGYRERIRLDKGLPRWVLNGRYPSDLAKLQEIVEGASGIATLGPYVDWAAVESVVAAGLASWLPPATICGKAATGISVPRQTMYPGSEGGEYRVWFDRGRHLRLQREEVVGGRAIHGMWCRQYVEGDGADLTGLTEPEAAGTSRPETIVQLKAIQPAQVGSTPAGIRPAGAYRLSRTWTGSPPDRMLPSGSIDILTLESGGAPPAYIFAADLSAPAPLRMEWLHDAAGLTADRQKVTGVSAPSLLGTWSNESSLQGAAWLAGGRGWVYVGPGATLGKLVTALRDD